MGDIIVIGGFLLLVYIASNNAPSSDDFMDPGIPEYPDADTQFIGNRQINIRITTYHPFDVRDVRERQMEGGTRDRKGYPILTLEEHLADADTFPYVSVAADYTKFKYGERVKIPSIERQFNRGIVFRIVDTGGHFFGDGKMVREPGYEPFDIAVKSRNTKIKEILTEAWLP